MAVRTFRKWALANVPTTLRGTWGSKLIELYGFTFDTITESTFEGGAAQSLYAPSCPVDALAYIGNERTMERYAAETDSAYKTRLKGAWTAWAQAGTSTGILSQLAAGGYTAAIKEMKDWNWDGDTANGSRFWVVITGHGWSKTHWGDGRKWGEGVWGANATRNEARMLIRTVRKWKPGHVVPIIIIVMDNVAWLAGQPDGTWGNPANRNTAALYHYYR